MFYNLLCNTGYELNQQLRNSKGLEEDNLQQNNALALLGWTWTAAVLERWKLECAWTWTGRQQLKFAIAKLPIVNCHCHCQC
jgi:hypothetical protein